MNIPSNHVRNFLLSFIGLHLLLLGHTTASPSEKLKPGMVVVAKVVGKVEALAPTSKKTLQLRKSDVISEKSTVTVGPASSATLAFSNGAVINLLENTTLVLSQFLQDPFSSPFAKTTTGEEPSTSVTALNLTKGQVVTTVKKLRIEEGSSLVVDTPVGAAGVRGTTFSVTYVTDPNDPSKVTYTLSVTEGEVVFTDSAGKKVTIPAGKEAVIRVIQSTDPQTGEIRIREVLDFTIRDIPADRILQINQIANNGIIDSNDIFTDVLSRLPGNALDPNNFAPRNAQPPDEVTDPNPGS